MNKDFSSDFLLLTIKVRQRICTLDDHLIKRLLPFEFLVTPIEPLKSCISSKYIRGLTNINK